MNQIHHPQSHTDSTIPLDQKIYPDIWHKHVEYGKAHLLNNHRGEIIESLAFLSIVRWFETLKDLCLETNLGQLLADEEFRG